MFRYKLRTIRLSILAAMLVLAIGGAGCGAIKEFISLDSDNSNYKRLAITKVIAEEIASTAKELHRQEIIDHDQLQSVKKLYERCRSANDVVIDVMLTALDTGIVPHTDPNYIDAIENLKTTMADLAKFAASIGIKTGKE